NSRRIESEDKGGIQETKSNTSERKVPSRWGSEMEKSRRKGCTQNSGKQSCSRKGRARQQTDIRRIPSAGTESNGNDSKPFAASPSRSGYTTRHIRRYSQSRKDGAQ